MRYQLIITKTHFIERTIPDFTQSLGEIKELYNISENSSLIDFKNGLSKVDRLFSLKDIPNNSDINSLRNKGIALLYHKKNCYWIIIDTEFKSYNFLSQLRDFKIKSII